MIEFYWKIGDSFSSNFWYFTWADWIAGNGILVYICGEESQAVEASRVRDTLLHTRRMSRKIFRDRKFIL